MSKSSDAMEAFRANWDALKDARPDEGSFSIYGYPLSYESMDELFKRWSTTLGMLDEKNYWNTSAEVGIADGPISIQINELSGLVSNTKRQGVSWLLSNRFLDVTNNIQLQITAITRRQANLNKEVARLLATRSAEEMETIVAAAGAAKRIISLGSTAEDNTQKIADATSAIESANELAESTNSRLAVLAKEADNNTIIVNDDKVSISKSHAEVAELKKRAIERENELAKRIEEIDSFLTETDNSAKTAYKSVEDALRKVRDQGLAKSFQDRSNNLQSERRLWTYGFAGSALILLTIAIVFSVELSSMTYEALVVHLLRKVGLAAPLIWLGWYSARQVGRISRVQEDYEYKAASALAFQSYKDEAKLGGDPELEKKLLSNAIQTFGENPVRLYMNYAEEPISPVQAAIKELPPEKIAQILAAIGEQSLKAKFWPFGSSK